MSDPLATRLRDARHSAGLTQKQLAQAADLTASHLSELERGRARPSQASLSRIAAALHTTLEALLSGIAFKSRKAGRRKLRTHGDRVRRSFGVKREWPPMGTLWSIFRLARRLPQGVDLVRRVERQIHDTPFWRELKRLGERLNGHEQGFLLHCMANGGDLEEIHPRATGFERPLIDETGGRWIGIVIPVEGGHIVVFPQLGVVPERGSNRWLDFLVAVAVDGAVLHLDTEVHGGVHRHRREEDARRQEQLAMHTMVIPAAEVERVDFFERFMKAVMGRIRLPMKSRVRKTA